MDRVFELEFRWVLLQILYSICKPIHEVYSTLLLYSLSRDVVELSHAFLGTQSLKIHCQRMAIPPSNKSYKRIRKDTFLFWGGSRIKSCQKSYHLHIICVSDIQIMQTNPCIYTHNFIINSYSNNQKILKIKEKYKVIIINYSFHYSMPIVYFQ